MNEERNFTCPTIESSDCFLAPRDRSVLRRVRKSPILRSSQDEKRSRFEADPGVDKSGSSSEKRARYCVTISKR